MRAIVITSIYPPTEAVRKFAAMKDHTTIIVGDCKTPDGWESEGAAFLSVEAQGTMGFRLFSKLPYNHYGRKMLGYLYAIRAGAEIIVDTDDDNIPKPDWCVPEFDGAVKTTRENLGFVNVYSRYTEQHIWPRGFPLGMIKEQSWSLADAGLKEEQLRVGVWQGLADGDPDVDAIYRLTLNTPCYFQANGPVVLRQGTLCPFNSQNTAFRKELFPLLYLPAYVTFRFTDILRGLLAQPIMWQEGYYLGFTSSSVIQERNPHDYMKDFADEIPCYLYPEKIIGIVSGAIRAGASLADNLFNSYEALHRESIVPKEELELLTLWLQDIGGGA
jgi:hypothetical protein